MSGGYYNGQQQVNTAPQYMHQVYGHGHGHGHGCVPTEEYLRQPATSPYPSAPTSMPEPPVVVRMTEVPAQQPSVIVMQPPPPPRHHDCCTLMCRCVDWLFTRILHFVLTLIVLAVIIGLAVWLFTKYRKH